MDLPLWGFQYYCKTCCLTICNGCFSRLCSSHNVDWMGQAKFGCGACWWSADHLHLPPPQSQRGKARSWLAALMISWSPSPPHNVNWAQARPSLAAEPTDDQLITPLTTWKSQEIGCADNQLINFPSSQGELGAIQAKFGCGACRWSADHNPHTPLTTWTSLVVIGCADDQLITFPSSKRACWWSADPPLTRGLD